jgi:hypothetical protein
MPANFEDAVLRLERAREQIESFEQDVAAFLNAHPSGFSVDRKPNTNRFTIRLRVQEPAPPKWRVILQEIVGNMRSPLDYVIVELADANGGHTNRTAFPIYAKPKDYRDKSTSKLVNVPSTGVDIVKSVQPYHGGDYLRLDLLRRLDDDGKHKRLHAAPSGIVNAGFGIGNANIRSLHIIRQYPFALEDGDPLMIFELDGEMEMHPDFTPEVVLGKRTAAQGRPLIRTLREIHETTTVVIDQFVQTFG